MSYGYYKPTTLEEALALKRDEPGARFVAGGTDLFVQMRHGASTPPPALISTRNIAALRGIELRADSIRIGAAITLTEIADHPGVTEALPSLVQSIALLGSVQIRNVATLAGNLCNASPAANTAGPLLVHEARVEITSSKGERRIALTDLFVGPGVTSLQEDEMVTAVLVKPQPGVRTAYLRKGRIRMDCAIASVAALVEMDGSRCTRARLSAGAVGPVPLRLRRVEELLEGSELGAAQLDAAVQTARDEVAPIDDVRSTVDYRRHLVGVYVRRALDAVCEERR